MYLDADNRRSPLTPQLAIRVAMVGGIALVAFALIFFRLWYLQVLSGTKYVAEARVELLSALPASGQLVGRELDRQAHAVVHERPALAVDDLPAGGLHLDLAHHVALSLDLVLVAREHLQVPEAEEHDRERHQGDAADDGHAHRELRCERRTAGVVVEVHRA